MNKTLRLLIFLLSISWGAFAQIPAGFQDNEYEGGFDQVTGVTFDALGRMFTWEKGGKVFVRNNSTVSTMLLNIGDEVNVATDSGLKGFALDPNFQNNGYIYLMYDVDRYFLLNSNSPNYDPNQNDHLNASIGRITRYTVDVNNFTSIVPNSRLILLGTTMTDGFPFIHDSHTVGTLIFGTDGTLLASCGDASATTADSGDHEDTYHSQALSDGILKYDDSTTPENENENVGSWRAQMVNCLSGKIIRIDPATGDGVPSNPFYDPTQPRAAKSRVWAMGFRNPFRMTLKPNTGEHMPSAGNPGVIYVGDVGSFQREEMNVVTAAGQNFGWPRFEGIVEQSMENIVVQYPFGRYEQFSVPFTHKRPAVDFRASPARAYVNGQIHEIGTSAPNAIAGLDFLGGCSVAGVFYDGINFPPEYQGRYFHGNFNNNGDSEKSWIHGFSMNNQDELTQMHGFLSSAMGVTGIAINPANGYLYYTSYGANIREVKYDPTGNQAPIARATQNVLYGLSPLTVQFNGTTSSDPEGGPLTYSWDFGDGSATSTSSNPTHVFEAPNSNPIQYNVVLTVTDDNGLQKSVTLIVSVNNTPPVINSTSVSNMNFFPNTGVLPVTLTANVSDNETSNAQLIYKWESALHHDTHFHANPVSFQPVSSVNLESVPCDNEVYFYRIKLTITDPQGLSTTYTKDIAPNCGGADTQPPTMPNNLQDVDKTKTTISLSWNAATDNVGVVLYEIFQNGNKIDESLNTTYTVSGLVPKTQYTYTITAKDAAGNVSNPSVAVNITTMAVTQDLIIYGNVLNSDWNSTASTIPSLYFFNTTQPFINTTSIKVTNPAFDQNLDLRYNSGHVDTTGYLYGLDFWVYNSGNMPYPLQIQTFSNNNGTGGSSSINVDAGANKWTHFQFGWDLFGSPSKLGGIVIKLLQTQSQSIYFDEIKLLYCAEMFSIASGNWNTPSTWSCGRTPIVTDDITINAGHTVTIPNGVNATLKFLYLLGTLNPLSGSTFNIYKF